MDAHPAEAMSSRSKKCPTKTVKGRHYKIYRSYLRLIDAPRPLPPRDVVSTEGTPFPPLPTLLSREADPERHSGACRGGVVAGGGQEGHQQGRRELCADRLLQGGRAQVVTEDASVVDELAGRGTPKSKQSGRKTGITEGLIEQTKQLIECRARARV